MYMFASESNVAQSILIGCSCCVPETLQEGRGTTRSVDRARIDHMRWRLQPTNESIAEGYSQWNVSEQYQSTMSTKSEPQPKGFRHNNARDMSWHLLPNSNTEVSFRQGRPYDS